MQQRLSTMTPFAYIEACIASQRKVRPKALRILAMRRYGVQFLCLGILGFLATLIVWLSDVDVSSGMGTWASELRDLAFWSSLPFLVAFQCATLAMIHRTAGTNDAYSHRIVWNSSLTDWCISLLSLWFGLLVGVMTAVIAVEILGYSAPQSVVSFVTALNPEFKGVALRESLTCALQGTSWLLAPIIYMRMLTITGIYAPEYKGVTRGLGLVGFLIIVLLGWMLWKSPSDAITIQDMPILLLLGALLLGGLGLLLRGRKPIDIGAVREDIGRAGYCLLGGLLLGVIGTKMQSDQQLMEVSAILTFIGGAILLLRVSSAARWWVEKKARSRTVRRGIWLVRVLLTLVGGLLFLAAVVVLDACQ